VDTDFSAPVTKDNLVSLVVYFREPQHVKTVIIDGEVVMKDGNLLTLDEARINAEAQATALRIWEKGNKKT
jgi:cytosine/adenosine deaminase-related metal-dependent hydrolase